MRTPDPSTIELAKVWSTAIAAVGVAIFSFAANLIITLMRTSKREMEMRRYESDLRLKADLRMKLFTMQAESVRDITTTAIQLVDTMDDWSHIIKTISQRTPDGFVRDFTEKQNQALVTKRAFSTSGLFMPPELHNAYLDLNAGMLPRLVEMAKCADLKDAPRMREHLPPIHAAIQGWTVAVAEWKSAAWQDVLGTTAGEAKPKRAAS